MNYSTVVFNKNALLKNLENLPSKNICAMVKANAYGCGVKDVCQTLKNKVKFFGVSNLNEALEIRKFDKSTSILIVGYTNNFATAVKNNISITVENLCQLNNLIRLSKKIKKKIKIHIKINTGMNRYGINKLKILKKIIKKLKNNKKIFFEGIFTHFFNFQNKKIFNKQLNLFNKYLKIISKNFNPIKHIGGGEVFRFINLAKYKEFYFRVGIKLYQKNVIQIRSKIIKVYHLNKGAFLGYDCGFRAKKQMKIGLVPLGYADGVNRKLSNVAFVEVNNKKCKIIGNICMDVFFIDLTNVSVKQNQKVIVFRDANYWANICKTIPYEILTSLDYKRMNKVIYNSSKF